MLCLTDQPFAMQSAEFQYRFRRMQNLHLEGEVEQQEEPFHSFWPVVHCRWPLRCPKAAHSMLQLAVHSEC